MEILQWNHYFETGIADVDKQHQHLVNVTNDFGQMLSHGQLQANDVEKVFSELVSYTQYHFDEEEKLMNNVGVDSRHTDSHAETHKGFLNDVLVMKQMIADEKAGLTDLFEFLMNWLVYHILGDDKNMARQVQALQNGESAQSAFKNNEKVPDSASGMLLLALNNLFSQVSDRNKELADLNKNLEDRVAQRTEELQEANTRLGELVLTDPLTGLSNRRHAMQSLEQLWQESGESHNRLGCMMIDADGFKQINDQFGHDAGDIVLCELSRHLKYSVRTDDLVCRLGGDEFLVICPNTDQKGTEYIAAITHGNIAALKVPVDGGFWQGSISVGVAARTELMKKPEDLLKKADENVYAAKRAGKNCVVS